MLRAIALGLALIIPTGAQAQEEPAHVCYAGGVQFSPGATFRAGNTVMRCTPDLMWEETSEWSMGCMSEGRLYGPGAEFQKFAASNAYICGLDGSWSRIDTE